MSNQKKEKAKKAITDMLDEYKVNMEFEIETSVVSDEMKELVLASTKQTFYLVDRLGQLLIDSMD